MKTNCPFDVEKAIHMPLALVWEFHENIAKTSLLRDVLLGIQSVSSVACKGIRFLSSVFRSHSGESASVQEQTQ